MSDWFGLHLDGKALQWHRAYMRIPSWAEYVNDITNRFGDGFDDPMAELMNLKQTGSVRFDTIINT